MFVSRCFHNDLAFIHSIYFSSSKVIFHEALMKENFIPKAHLGVLVVFNGIFKLLTSFLFIYTHVDTVYLYTLM